MNSMAPQKFRTYTERAMARNPILRPAVAACTLSWIILTWIIVPAAAADKSSRWDGDARSAIRLIAGTRGAGDAVIPAGIEIKLKPGWHTYWRYPGDAGIPPHFDFQGSQNVKSVEVRWPAPKRLPEGSVMTIGYDRDVTLSDWRCPRGPRQAGHAADEGRLCNLREGLRAGRRQG